MKGVCRARLSVRLQVAEKCVSVPSEHALIGATGLFVRQIELPVGTPVVVRFCRRQDEVSLRGIVSATYPDLGVSVEFKRGLPWARKKIGGTTMKVRELAARLEKADPEDLVFIDSASQCLFLLNRRTGMFQPLDEHEAVAKLTEPDKQFLHVLRVRF
jgi:hypothetical protein